MSALKEIFSEPFYAGDVCGDMILATDTVAKFNRNHDPKDGKFAAGTGGGIVAYHGTPHIVPEFSTSAIGSGQGAQSYGYGLYFAQEPQVASTYKNAGKIRTYQVKNKSGRWDEIVDPALKNVASYIIDGGKDFAINTTIGALQDRKGGKPWLMESPQLRLCETRTCNE